MTDTKQDDIKIDEEAAEIMNHSSNAWPVLKEFHTSILSLLATSYPPVRACMLHHDELMEFIAPPERQLFEERIELAKNKIKELVSRTNVVYEQHKDRSGHPQEGDEPMLLAEQYTAIAEEFAALQCDSLYSLTTTVNDWVNSTKGTEDV